MKSMRIVSLVPSVTETLFELGLGNEIVAITRWCTRPQDQVRTKPKVGGTKNPKIDEIRKWAPDIVILDCDENRKEDAEALEKSGIRTLSVFPKSIDDSIQLLRDFGKLFSVEDRAESWIQEIQARRNALSPEHFPALILIWRSPYMTVNRDTYVHAAAKMFGFDNVFAAYPERYPRLNADEIKRANPQCVLFPDEPYPFRQKHIEIFKKEFPQIAAVQTNNLFTFDGSYLAWHGFGTLRALREFTLTKTTTNDAGDGTTRPSNTGIKQ
jgi:ABC-type Fe3+-hydroxamate transport system substrate-binding protein